MVGKLLKSCGMLGGGLGLGKRTSGRLVLVSEDTVEVVEMPEFNRPSPPPTELSKTSDAENPSAPELALDVCSAMFASVEKEESEKLRGMVLLRA